MGLETLVAGLGLAVAGTSAVMQAEARSDASDASRRAESARREQMRQESMRKQRENFRQMFVARAAAAQRSVNSGAGQGEDASSSLFGAFGQIQGAFGRAYAAENTNLEIGEDIFQANMDRASAESDVATWEGVGKIGTSLVTNSNTIGKIGSSLFPGSGGSRTTSSTSGSSGGLDVLPGSPY